MDGNVEIRVTGTGGDAGSDGGKTTSIPIDLYGSFWRVIEENKQLFKTGSQAHDAYLQLRQALPSKVYA